MLSGIFNVLKPPGMTSHDVVNIIRKAISQKKVGHTGTLDPDAVGVLPIFVGNATRLIEYADDSTKSYRAELTLGIKTDTGDDSGDIIETCDISNIDLSQENITNTLTKFIGEISQIPPMYSAIKVQGKKLYQLARAGQTIERKPRQITIYDIKLIKTTKNTLLLDVDCSRGTYIRTLLEDIAEKLGTCGTMSFLVRTKSSIFSLENACLLDEIKMQPEKYLLSAEEVVQYLPQIVLTENQALRFCQGVKTTYENPFTGNIRIYSHAGIFLGIGSTEGNFIKAQKVLNQSF